MHRASLLLVTSLLVLATVGPLAEAAVVTKGCKGTNPAPVSTRCTFLVGGGWLTYQTSYFTHTCASDVVPGQPCYAGTMEMVLAYAGGSWTRICDQVVSPGGSAMNACTTTGKLPPVGRAFAVECNSYWLQGAEDAESPFLVRGGTGPFGCWVRVTR